MEKENNYMYPTNNDQDKYLYPNKEKQDLNYEIKDYRTDYGKGIGFKTCDGKEVATMEEVMAYNQMYYDAMKKKTPEEKGMHR